MFLGISVFKESPQSILSSLSASLSGGVIVHSKPCLKYQEADIDFIMARPVQNAASLRALVCTPTRGVPNLKTLLLLLRITFTLAQYGSHCLNTFSRVQTLPITLDSLQSAHPTQPYAHHLLYGATYEPNYPWLASLSRSVNFLELTTDLSEVQRCFTTSRAIQPSGKSRWGWLRCLR